MHRCFICSVFWRQALGVLNCIRAILRCSGLLVFRWFLGSAFGALGLLFSFCWGGLWWPPFLLLLPLGSGVPGGSPGGLWGLGWPPVAAVHGACALICADWLALSSGSSLFSLAFLFFPSLISLSLCLSLPLCLALFAFLAVVCVSSRLLCALSLSLSPLLLGSLLVNSVFIYIYIFIYILCIYIYYSGYIGVIGACQATRTLVGSYTNPG